MLQVIHLFLENVVCFLQVVKETEIVVMVVNLNALLL